MLNEDQTKAKENIKEALNSSRKPIVLKGSAGTGKTYLIGKLVEDLGISKSKIYVTAPTNKALSIIQSKYENVALFRTCHSSLGLKRKINQRTGEITFQQDIPNKSYDSFKRAKLCIIDEGSMIESKVLDYFERSRVPILICGDPKQLNPVGELISPVWVKPYTFFELNTIVRQQEGSPIIELSNDLSLIHSKENKLVGMCGYLFINNLDRVVNLLAEANGTNDVKYVSWTNEDVNLVNRLVRQKIYNDPKRFELGESLIFDSPYGHYFTNQEIIVSSLKIVKKQIFLPRQGSHLRGKVLYGHRTTLEISAYEINGDVYAIEESSYQLFANMAANLKQSCSDGKLEWSLYYFFIEQVANLKYNHALSIHKAQGSSYVSTIINIGNIMQNPIEAERERLLYTAITRSSNLTLLYNA